MVKFLVDLKERIHKRLKHFSIDKKVTMNEIINNYVEKGLEREDK